LAAATATCASLLAAINGGFRASDDAALKLAARAPMTQQTVVAADQSALPVVRLEPVTIVATQADVLAARAEAQRDRLALAAAARVPPAVTR
jgi:hypothetical protein